MRGRDLFEKFKPIMNILVNIISVFPAAINYRVFVMIRNVNGKLGLGLRYIYLKALCKDCGDNVSVHPGVYLFSLHNLSIGNNVSIHPLCYIDASAGIDIGDDVSIAHSVSILSTTHNFDNLEMAINNQGTEEGKVIISDNNWIGCKVTITYNLTIGNGNVIGANTLVNKNISDNNVVGGVPMKIIRNRSDNETKVGNI